ncbi:MAG: MiaB/RimO family radical SAM methylthiotransferase [Phycisphaerales bacterium]
MKPAVYLETFGCQMNELDSQLVTGSLRALGYTFTSDAEAASVVLYNTCSVRELAEQKVWSRLGELAVRKHAQPDLVVGVIGCMAEREGPALMKRMPVVDLMVGPGELDKLPGLLDNAVRTRASMTVDADSVEADAHAERPKLVSTNQSALQGNTNRRSTTLAAAADTLELLDLSRAVSPDDHTGSAYVRITRGCNKFCTYCVVPFTRGAEVHRPPQHIIDECRKLADAGVIEVTLLGQTVNHYRFEHGAAVTLGGITQPQKGRVYKAAASDSENGHRDAYAGANVTTFADLLHRIHEQVPAIQRLRFVTSYPKSFGDDVLTVIRNSPRICRYLHVPAQSGSDRILGLMNRGYTVGEYLDFIDRARAQLHQPEIGRPLTLAGDIIVGFPTETEDDYAATVALLHRVRYKNCFIFKYSPRPGTTAIDRFADDVPEDVKRRRNNDLLAIQNAISAEVGAEFVGQTLDVFVQGLSKREAKKRREPKPTGIALTIAGRTFDSDEDAQGACSADGCGTHVTVAETDATATGPVQLSARTEGDLIVFFDLPPGRNADDLIGSIVPVKIESSAPLSLHGRVIDR